MMFEYLCVRVADGEGVLGPHYELVRVARVLIVVEQVRQEGREHVLQLQVVTHITRIEQVVHALEGVNDV